MRGMRPLAVGCLTALATLLIAAGAEATPRDFWGVYAFNLPSLEESELMNETGVEISRVQFDWREIEPQAPDVFGQRTYDWVEMDAWVGNLARNGVATQALLLGSPRWLTPSTLHTPMKTSEGQEGWAAFVRAVVDRYGRGGSFWVANPTIPAVPIEVFQIWNEQNSSSRYRPKPDVDEYAGLLRLAEREIRQADPKARVLLGGMFGTPNDLNDSDGSMPAWDFLDKLYALPGAASRFDAVGVHPYSPNLRGVRYQLKKIRASMRKAGDGATAVEVTELGWSSGTSDSFFFFAGRKGQARKLDAAVGMLLEKRRKWNIERIVWLAWRDTQSTEGCGYCEKFGLVKEDLRPKPSFKIFKQYATSARPR